MSIIDPGLIATQANVDAMKPSFEELRDTCVSRERIIEATLFLVSPAELD